MGLKRQNRSKVLRIVAIPATALARARDVYVKSMTTWASRASYCHCMWATQQLPKSYSVGSSTSDEFRDLIRAASVRRFGYSNEIDVLLSPAKLVVTPSPESLGRIDEDTAEDDWSAGGVVGETTAFVELCPGSKTYAIGKTTAL